MNRTTRATIVAGIAVAVTVYGLGLLLGFDAVSSVAGAVILGAAMASLIWLAARRAETFHDARIAEPDASSDHARGAVDGDEPPRTPPRSR